jgi:CheY-like chemotaxis protein/CheY-specific phosphatase CheX
MFGTREGAGFHMSVSKPKHALIIDDDNEVLEVMATILKRTGLNVVAAQSAHEARMKLMNQPFDIIFVDINMPKETGIQFLGSLRQSMPDLKAHIAVISGLSMEDVARAKMMSVLGVDQFFSKPLSAENLTKWVQQKLTQKKSYNIEIINAFLNGTINAIQNNTGIPPTKGNPTAKEQASTLGEFSGVIHFHGKSTRGVLVLSFERSCVTELANKVFMGAIPELTDKILIDFAGELCNQTAGQTQAIFQAAGNRFEIGTPTLIQGLNHQIIHKFDAPCLILPFTWGPGKLYTEFVVENVEGTTPNEKSEQEVQSIGSSGDVSFL